MNVKAVLFDLDGTLLPMNQEEFTKAYFGLLAKKLMPYGYEAKSLIDAIWSGTTAMVKNNGEKNNETVFWDDFEAHYGEDCRNDITVFEDFYNNEFDGAKTVCGFNPLAAQTVAKVKEKGLSVVLATNPIFPAVATKKRICWAGLKPEDFEFYTTYENSFCSKPNPKYYTDIAKRLNLLPEECLMVGNDVREDMVAQSVGMKVFLLTDCIINKDNTDISVYPSGDFNAFIKWLDK